PPPPPYPTPFRSTPTPARPTPQGHPSSGEPLPATEDRPQRGQGPEPQSRRRSPHASLPWDRPVQVNGDQRGRGQGAEPQNIKRRRPIRDRGEQPAGGVGAEPPQRGFQGVAPWVNMKRGVAAHAFCGHTTPHSSVGGEGFEPSHPFGHTDLNRARLPFRHPPRVRTRHRVLGGLRLRTPEK